MNLADYRLEPGLYQVGLHTIIRGGRDHWQLRDEFDDIVDIFPTCRAAITEALRVERVRKATTPTRKPWQAMFGGLAQAIATDLEDTRK